MKKAIIEEVDNGFILYLEGDGQASYFGQIKPTYVFSNKAELGRFITHSGISDPKVPFSVKCPLNLSKRCSPPVQEEQKCGLCRFDQEDQ